MCCLFALLASAQATAAADLSSADTAQLIALSGMYEADLEFESTDGVVRVVPGTTGSSAPVQDKEKEVVAVPLPAAIWLFGSALVGFIMLSNKRSL
jgi:hypothetical protein